MGRAKMAHAGALSRFVPYLPPMPALQFDRYADGSRSVVWDSTESPEELSAALPAAWRGRLPPHPARRRETLGARRALLALDERLEDRQLAKDTFGKPYLLGDQTQHFSLSHSHGHAAALLADAPCGVDLQLRVEKITRLRSKFERADERAYVSAQADEVAALHILWGAKESLYKLWGRRQIDWHEHLIVGPFDASAGLGTFGGEVRFGAERMGARLFWRWLDRFCLVVAIHEP